MLKQDTNEHKERSRAFVTLLRNDPLFASGSASSLDKIANLCVSSGLSYEAFLRLIINLGVNGFFDLPPEAFVLFHCVTGEGVIPVAGRDQPSW